MAEEDEAQGNQIAVVGMACRLPGAEDPDAYWRNLRDGVESVRFYDDEELLAAGVSPAELQDPNYVRAGAPLDGMEMFDAEFFGFGPQDAAIMDPQHRQLLECAWEALEQSGHVPSRFEGPIGVFAGCGQGTYYSHNIQTNRDLVDSVGLFLLRHTGNDKDFLSTRISYCLDLKGPSISVQTACSTSLVAIHYAVNSLLSGECDMALAGGVTIELPHRAGYIYQPGEILSPDGHCRAFDHRSQGTIFGSGAGLVALRRLEDALEDGDPIFAVLLGSAINNDGSGKVGYLAPSVDGQAEAIAEAMSVADVDPESISYIEAHGTGTPVGDPIELSALTQAFGRDPDEPAYCGIGSVKTNIGHLDTAAGIASFIKVCQALRHRQLPPSLNFEAPNPELQLDDTPFYINHTLKDWQVDGPRRAGVSSLGVGGTNAHVIVEEAPAPPKSGASSQTHHPLLLSARNKTAVVKNAERLADYLEREPDVSLADVAYTLDIGRHGFAKRAVAVVTDREDAIRVLRERPHDRFATGTVSKARPSVAFLFPGGGAQYPRMAKGLYESDPDFRADIDRGLSLMKEREQLDLRPLLFPDDASFGHAKQELLAASRQLPATFMVEYALARLWTRHGVEPAALLGHSMGENTAACLAGVMTFEECLGLIALRGRLLDKPDRLGGMLSIALSATEAEPYLGNEVELGCINSPGLCVLSGPAEVLTELQQRLERDGVEATRLGIDVAAHSRMLDPMLGTFRDYLAKLNLQAPQIPIVSNLSGTFMTDEQAQDPDYWVEHLRNTVRFSQGVDTLLAEPGRILLEVGPGKTLGSLARQSAQADACVLVASSLRHPDEEVADEAAFLRVLGNLWNHGLPLDLSYRRKDEQRRRLVLPTYAFQRQHYFIEPGKNAGASAEEQRLTDGYFSESWQLQPAPRATTSSPRSYLIYIDECGLGENLAERLRDQGNRVVTVAKGNDFAQLEEGRYLIDSDRGRDGHDQLVGALLQADFKPDHVVHAWLYTHDMEGVPEVDLFHHTLETGFYSVLYAALALADQGLLDGLRFDVVSSGMHQVGEERLRFPDKALALGPLRVLPREASDLRMRGLDFAVPERETPSQALAKRFALRPDEGLRTLEQLTTELLGDGPSGLYAFRGAQRFVQGYQRITPNKPDQSRLKEGGVYLITGGLGGIGLAIARHLASLKARLVLVSRTVVPKPELWDSWLERHGADNRLSRIILSVRELESLGAEVLLTPADVANLSELEVALADAEQRFGALDGVVHAAGVLKDGLSQTKDQREIEGVLQPKVYGLRNLRSLLANKRLDFFVAFSSTSIVSGPAGQVDYVAANAYLGAVAKASGRSSCPISSLGWGVWNEVGMAYELAAEMSGEKRPDVRPGEAPHFALFQVREEVGDDELRFLGELSPETDWLLDEHRTLDGHALVPGTGIAQLLRAAVEEVEQDTPVELADLSFLRPLAIADGERRVFRVVLRRQGSGYSAELQSQHTLPDGAQGWEVHANTVVRLLRKGRGEPIDLAAIEQRCTRIERAEGAERLRSKQEAHLRFGPRFRVLQEMRYGDGEALAALSLPETFSDEVNEYRMHPALMDLATGFAMDLIEGYSAGELWVPMTYHSIRVARPLPARVRSHVRNAANNRASEPVASFDITVTDMQGRPVLIIEGFTIRRMDAGMTVGAPEPPAPRDLMRDDEPQSSGAAALSPAQRAFRRSLALGITPQEGVRGFETVISSPQALPEVFFSSLPLEQLIREADEAALAAEPAAQFERPELDSEYVEPRDDLEKGLCALWTQQLGVSRVGIKDSFFDLGGHSLVAVRLFNAIKKEYGVELPLSTLFEAPDVEQLAARVRAEMSDTLPGGGPQGQAKPQRGKTVVPIQPSGDRPPVFCAAGMGGNPMNLRHLALHLGADQPFYGLQHRGTDGKEMPHESVEAMADEYMADIQSVQPHGPYYLGGFSGGGTAAYEVAQRLMNAGEEVALLFFLDSFCPTMPDRPAMERAQMHLQRLREHGASYAWQTVSGRVAGEVGRVRDAFVRPLAKIFPYELRNAHVQIAWVDVESRYHPQAYHGPVHLFRVNHSSHNEPTRQQLDNSLGWSGLIGDLQVHEVPGDHETMCKEPYVRTLAERLGSALEMAQREAAE